MSANAVSAVEPSDDTESRRARGAFYTPEALADWVADLVLSEGPPDPKIVDFGCGEGALLTAVAKLSPNACCFGVETNAIALSRASLFSHAKGHFIHDDVLSPAQKHAADLASHWRRVLRCSPDAVIMNPPWGAERNVCAGTASRAGLTLASGQYDTYDLFCELALQVVRPGGTYGFILPDSLFLPEHRRLREILVRHTSISLIARLGEGIFPGVYRGCVVVVGHLRSPHPGQQVECLRITKSLRNGLASAEDFERARLTLSHHVLQSRFAGDSESRFDIDVSVSDGAVQKMLETGGGWTVPLASRRGVELSKAGRILLCRRCGIARPLPKQPHSDCLSCGSPLMRSSETTIIADRPSAEGQWARFIAGEDVCRYSASSRRWIRTDFTGINYKLSPRTGQQRLLIRKTGIGINAALDSSGAFTNQVVFEYVLAPERQYDFSYLHYVLGVLSSRILFAFHLKRSGELEWRSHPYVTQRTLAELPIPNPVQGSARFRQAAAIAGAVQQHLSGHDQDLRIEALVGGLYELSTDDMRWALDVLRSAADLEAMRRLRLPADQAPEPLLVTT